MAALVVVPIFFDPHSARTFDADKILLLRSIALVMLLGLIVWVIEEGPGAYTSGGRPLWHAPVVAPMLLLTGAYGVSTIVSIAPRISFWGAYFRCQGTVHLAELRDRLLCHRAPRSTAHAGGPTRNHGPVGQLSACGVRADSTPGS